MAQPLRRLANGHPTYLAHLAPRPSVACRLHRPVAHHLWTELEIGVARAGQLRPKLATQSGLLLALSHRRLLVGLAVLDLPLRERPVAIPRTVDQQHFALRVAASPPDDAARCSDLRLQTAQALRPRRSSRFHAFGSLRSAFV